MNIDFIYLIILILCFIFSIVGTIYQYSKNKYKLVNLCDKVIDGWGLYKVKLEKFDDKAMIPPSTDEECLYYYAKLNYEEKVITPVNKKKIDVKFFKQKKEKFFHNKFYIKFFDYTSLVDTKNIEITLESNIKEKVDIPMKDNEKIINLEEKFIKESNEYFCLINIIDNKVEQSTIKLSDNIENFKKNFYFEFSLIWTPTILFGLAYKLLV